MLKQEAKSPFLHKFAGDIFYELKVQFEQHFSDLNGKVKEISVF